MNGKQAKVLRKLRRDDQKSKRLYKSLPHYVRGMIRTMYKRSAAEYKDSGKLGRHVSPDFLGQVTGNYERSKPNH